MTFPKILSGDFVAEYNRLMNQLNAEQGTLDEKYGVLMKELIQRENDRLKSTVKPALKVGDVVQTFDNRRGTIVAWHVAFDPVVEQGWNDLQPYGPAKYYSIASEKDESMVTCEDLMQRFTVEFEPNQLEMDWGSEDVVLGGYYADELSYVLPVKPQA